MCCASPLAGNAHGPASRTSPAPSRGSRDRAAARAGRNSPATAGQERKTGLVHHFEQRDGTLFAEDIDLNVLAAEVGTPFYVYSSATLRRHVRVVQRAFEGIPTLIAYAMKANSNQAVLKLMAAEGCGADVVSLGELERALAAGIAPDR